MQLFTKILKNTLDHSFYEDFGINGDITSNSVIDQNAEVNFHISSRENIILCGVNIAQYFFDNYSSIKYKILFDDSEKVQAGDVIISGRGNEEKFWC